uniref:Uncharacterized protein n=1 Tax=Anopheles atroparvus TaxID=41427 RepID=A0A182JGH2_ANOAO
MPSELMTVGRLGSEWQVLLAVPDLAQFDLTSDLVRAHHDREEVDAVARERPLGAVADAMALRHDVLLAGRDDVPPVRVHADRQHSRVMAAQRAGVEQLQARVVHHRLRLRGPPVVAGAQAIPEHGVCTMLQKRQKSKQCKRLKSPTVLLLMLLLLLLSEDNLSIPKTGAMTSPRRYFEAHR